MAIFNSYVKLPEGICLIRSCVGFYTDSFLMVGSASVWAQAAQVVFFSAVQLEVFLEHIFMEAILQKGQWQETWWFF